MYFVAAFAAGFAAGFDLFLKMVPELYPRNWEVNKICDVVRGFHHTQIRLIPEPNPRQLRMHVDMPSISAIG